MAKSTLPGYRVEIRKPSSGIFIVADLPETYSQQVSSSFESRSSSMGIEGASGAAGAVNSWLNASIMSKALSNAVWKGTSPIQFSLDLIFNAETSAYDDVVRHLIDLQCLVLPSDNNGGDFLYPPNPSIATGFFKAVTGGLVGTGENWRGASPTSVRIGRQYFFPSVIVLGATPTTESRMNSDLPIAGQINMSFQTTTVYSEQDLRKAAGMGIRGDGQ